MKLVATSDTHGMLPDIEPCDLLIIAGDVSPVNDDHAVYNQRYYARNFFFPWMKEQPANQIVWIAGNHDFFTEDVSFRQVLHEAPSNSWYLCDSTIEVFNKTIYGSPWVPNLPNWAWYADSTHFRKLGAAMPDCDIAVLHGPPFGYLDHVAGAGSVGAPFIEEGLRRAKPEVAICGHIHEGWGKAIIGDTDLYNVSFMDEMYDRENPRPPTVLEL